MPRIGEGRALPYSDLTAYTFSFYWRSGRFRLTTPIFNGRAETSHYTLTEIKLIMILNKTRHLRVYELFAEQLIGRHRGKNPKLLWGEL